MSVMQRSEIEAAIPHREPFLWIDEVVEITETRIHCRKFLAADLDVFRGHYPHFPVFPGVLQCEASFQAGALLISRLMPVDQNQVPVVTRINNVRFKHMLHPGDMLDIEVELTERLQNAFFLTGKVSSAGKVATRLEFACTAAPLNPA